MSQSDLDRIARDVTIEIPLEEIAGISAQFQRAAPKLPYKLPHQFPTSQPVLSGRCSGIRGAATPRWHRERSFSKRPGSRSSAAAAAMMCLANAERRPLGSSGRRPEHGVNISPRLFKDAAKHAKRFRIAGRRTKHWRKLLVRFLTIRRTRSTSCRYRIVSRPSAQAENPLPAGPGASPPASGLLLASSFGVCSVR